MNNVVKPQHCYRLPAEWEPKDAVILAWPDHQHLSVAEGIVELYEALVAVLVDYADIILVAPSDQFYSIRERLILMEVPLEFVYFSESDIQSINLRRIGPFIVEVDNQFTLITTRGSFPESLHAQKSLPCVKILHGNILYRCDAIQSDGGDNLLVNLPQVSKDNPDCSLNEIKTQIETHFSSKNIFWLEESLVNESIIRLCPDNKIAILDCDDEDSVFYERLSNTKHYLNQWASGSELDVELVLLPWAGIIKSDEDSEYLADYSQFVVINEAVLVPLFDLPSDEDAMEIVSTLFPGFDILGFPSHDLAVLKTGLMNITQTVPEGVLEPL
jgi:agmatine deiminase